MVSGKMNYVIVLGLSTIFLTGCLEHKNPLDPENELTRGIGFIGMYSADYPERVRFSGENLLYTFPYYSDGGMVEKYSLEEMELVRLGTLSLGSTVRDLAFSPTSREAVMISHNSVIFWDTGTMVETETKTIQGVSRLSDICYSTDGEWIYVAPSTGEELYVYSASSHDMTDTIPDLPKNIFHLYPYQDSIFLFSYYYSVTVTRLTITGDVIEREDWSDDPRYFRQDEDLIAFSPGDRRFIYASASQLYHGLLAEPMNMEEESFPETILDIEIDPLGEYLYVGGHYTAMVYLLPSLQPFLSYRLSEELEDSFLLYGLEASPDGKNVFINSVSPSRQIARLKIRF